jgi:hypothetical protein
MAARPRIIFDTTGINKLEDGGSASEPLMRALESGYEVILIAMSADEVRALRPDCPTTDGIYLVKSRGGATV